MEGLKKDLNDKYIEETQFDLASRYKEEKHNREDI